MEGSSSLSDCNAFVRRRALGPSNDDHQMYSCRGFSLIVGVKLTRSEVGKLPLTELRLSEERAGTICHCTIKLEGHARRDSRRELNDLEIRINPLRRELTAAT